MEVISWPLARKSTIDFRAEIKISAMNPDMCRVGDWMLFGADNWDFSSKFDVDAVMD
jgi:hypothetical protein